MTRWVHSYWPDDGIWFYFEVDDEGFVLRQVELEGPDRVANAACSVREWEEACRAGMTARYEAAYGMPAEWSAHSWDEHDLQPYTRAEFEAAWAIARRACEAGSRSRPDPEPGAQATR